jgi:hypothetical protein
MKMQKREDFNMYPAEASTRRRESLKELIWFREGKEILCGGADTGSTSRI